LFTIRNQNRNCSGIQETEFRSRNEGMNHFLFCLLFSVFFPLLSDNPENGNISESIRLIEETSKLLEAYMRAILNSDSWILNT